MAGFNNITDFYPQLIGELSAYPGPINQVTATVDNNVGTPHVDVQTEYTADGMNINFDFHDMGIPGTDLTVLQPLTEQQKANARQNINAQEVLTFDSAPTQGSQNPVTSGGVYTAEQAIASDVADIKAVIPAAATSQNQLADKEYVDDSINRSSAFFRGNFETRAALMAVPWQTTDPDAPNYVSNNDYAYVADDETHEDESWRYIYVLEEGGSNNGWAAQYRVNESPLTTEQLAAINSGITSAGVAQIETNRTGLASHVADTSNPHQVTKGQVGLGNVDNTSDADKPISTAQQAALDAKQDVIETGFLSNSDNAPYLYRRSGGGLTIGNRARLKLVGATIANNQLHGAASVSVVSPYRGVTFTISADGRTISFSGTATQAITIGVSSTNLHYENGHKYLILGNANDGGISLFPYAPANYRLNTSAFIWASDVTGDSPSGLGLRILSGTVTDGKSVTPQISDLTQDFGSTIADYAYTLEQGQEGAGIAWLKSYGFFSKYAPYDAGSLISTKAEKKKVVGFNQWDEEWTVNAIDSQTGLDSPGNYICSKNHIPVIAGKSYFLTPPATTNHYRWIYAYDADKNYLKTAFTANGYLTLTGANTFTVPEGVAFVRFLLDVAYGTTYKNDTSLNFNKPTGTPKNGDYVACASQEYDLGSDELRGLFKLDANNNIYADGDIKTPDGQITRKYGIVDLSTLTWTFGNGWYQTTISDIKYVSENTQVGNGVAENFTVRQASGFSTAVAGELAIDTTNVKAKTGTGNPPTGYLVYELATPTTEQGTPFQDPQEVFADGTEEFIDTRTVPVPAGHETEYPGTTYLASKLGDETVFTEFAPEVPPAPAADGTYVLQVEVSEGTPFYRWISASELAGE